MKPLSICCWLVAFCLREISATVVSGGGTVIETSPYPASKLAAEKAALLPTATPGTELMQFLAEPTPSETPGQDVGTADPTTAKVSELVQQAMAHINARELEEATALIDEADKLQPGLPTLVNMRGAIFTQKGQFAEARALYEVLAKLQPEALWPQYNLGELRMIEKDYPAARKQFQTALSNFPGNEILRFKIILTYLQDNLPAEAAAELALYQFPGNTPASYYANAALEYYRKNFPAAEGWIRSAAEIFGEEQTGIFARSLADLGFGNPPASP